MADKISYIARKFIEEDVPFAIAKVIATNGSAPRKRDAVLLMNFEGKTWGTVGGGLLEAETEKRCLEQLQTKEKIRTYEFMLDEKRSGEGALEMACGGDATIQIEYIDPRNPGSFVEDFKGSSQAFIFGGGHVALALDPVLRHVDFETTIIDDREEYSNSERFPDAKATIVCENFDHCFDDIETDEDSFLIIVTRGHKGDLQVLRQALKKPHAYLGMIGSRRKNALLYEQLLDEGVTWEELNTVYSPIGLDIKSETPEEIAISIVAEIIRARAEHNEGAAATKHAESLSMLHE
ncbi:MAG: XdhC/CoxI family protein [Eubacteriales bacterium]|nr:XdhC/CoxI family protein [Eubacteriales bacterium]